jgi:hypothetical protein
MKETREQYYARMDKAVRIFNDITNLRLKIKTLEAEVDQLCWKPENGREAVSSKTLLKWGNEYNEKRNKKNLAN